MPGLHPLINLRYFKVFTGTSVEANQFLACEQAFGFSPNREPVHRLTSSRLHMQALHRLVILQVKCTIRIQALCLLYLSHPPETGNGGKRSFDKGSDEEEKNVFWYLAFLSSQCVKAKTINSH